MTPDKQQLKGSERRDLFKRLHKDLDRSYYATDIDFALVSKAPPGVIAFFDYKTPWDVITFAEVLAYNVLLAIAPVYIVQAANPQTGPFQVLSYRGGDWRPNPPRVDVAHVQDCPDWAALGRWEAGLRQARATKLSEVR